MACVIVASGDESTRRALEQFVLSQGHLVFTAIDLPGLLRILQHWQVDVLILDTVWRQEQEREVQSTLQAHPLLKSTPILFLTWAEANVRRLLRPGRDDFLMKPVDPRQFKEKFYRLLGTDLQGCQLPSGHTMRCGPVSLDTATFQASVGGRPVSLTPTEFALLRHLMHRAGQVATVDELLEAVWGYAPGLGAPELVRVHIKNLRRKLEGKAEGDFNFIKTVPRYGYLVSAELGGTTPFSSVA